MQAAWAEVGSQLLVGDAGRQVRDPAAAELGTRATTGECAVEKDRQAQLAAQPIGRQQRLRTRRTALRLAHVNERYDIDRADVRMLATRSAEIDPRHRLARPGQQRLRKRRRGVLATEAEPHVGTRLWRDAAQHGDVTIRRIDAFKR